MIRRPMAKPCHEDSGTRGCTRGLGMQKTTRYRAIGWLAVAGLVAGALVGPTASAAAAAPLSGAIWTSLADGSSVNANHYAAKADVYLNGGPQNCNGDGLPDGLYYFQVTGPSGAVLLSTDAISARQVEVVDGVIAGVGPTGTHDEGDTGECGSVPVQLFPYNDTPNNGNEYSVDLAPAAEVAACEGFNGGTSTTLNFVKDCQVSQKNDNYKVGDAAPSAPPSTPPSAPPSDPPSDPPAREARIFVTKLLDQDGDASTVDDLIEGAGWSFEIDVDGGTASEDSITTDANGESQFDVTLTGEGTTVSITEILQADFDLLWADCAEIIGEGEFGDSFGEVTGLTLSIEIEDETSYDCIFANTSGEVAGITSRPVITPPSTDAVRAAGTKPAESPRFILLGIAALIAVVLVVTPTPAKRRRS